MRLIERIFNGGEQGIIKRSKVIAEHAKKANALMLQVISGKRDISGIRRLERLSDSELFNLTNSVTSGAIAPNLIDDVIRFLNTEDDIVDNIFNLSRAVIRYDGGSPAMRKYLNSNLSKFNLFTDRALGLLIEMHSAERISEMRKFRTEIEKYERKVDDVKDAMLNYAYVARLNYKQFAHITDIAYLGDNILDSCEDSADRLLGIMLSIAT